VPQSPRVDLGLLRQRVAEVHTRFYDGALGRFALTANAVPFLVSCPEGTTDRFNLDIDYFRYPLMFGEAFPGIPAAVMADMCLVAQLFAEALVGLDKVLDRQLRSDTQLIETVALLGSHHKLFHAMGVLHRHFQEASQFWTRFRELHAEYSACMVQEKLASGIDVPTIEAMERLCAGKVAMAKIITTALADLSGRWDRLSAAEASQDLYAVGYQIYDDVKDWRLDYERAQYSYLLRQAIRMLGLTGVVIAGRRPPADVFGGKLFTSGLVEDALERAEIYFQRAREAAAPLGCRAWLAWIGEMQARLVRLREDLVTLRARAEERARVRASPRIMRLGHNDGILEVATGAVRRGIVFLEDQQRKRYVEGAHLEMLPAVDGRRAARSLCHFGTVFVRAVVLHTLALARQNGFDLDDALFDEDIERLVEARVQDQRGGWRYFPDMSLPPDCDDLGEVLHVLLETGHPGTAVLCHDAIDLACSGQRADGSIDTWIADPDDPCAVEAKTSIVAAWGPGPDPEVIANFLHALWLYDRDQFAETIARGASYVGSRQGADGAWASNWYVGPYYGTWVCCRLLGAIGGWEHALRRAETFIRDTQSERGGWGPDDNALDTSFAMMALCGRPALSHASLAPAVQALLGRQRENGAWSGTPFIKMETVARRTTSMPGFQDELHTSDTLATAAAVRALLGVAGFLA
jgi:squalene-hopene/tetraprenyl-beta-curcumene cyclase